MMGAGLDPSQAAQDQTPGPTSGGRGSEEGGRRPLGEALPGGRQWLGVLGQSFACAGVLAALQLSASLYMLAIYDQVLPTGNVAALAVLTGLVIGLHVLFALVDMMRAQTLCREGLAFVRGLEQRLLGAGADAPSARGLAVLGDIERLGRFWASPGPPALLDALWLPAYLAVVFVLHPVLALYAAAGACALLWLVVAADERSRPAALAITRARRARHGLGRAVLAVPGRAAGARPGAPETAFRWRALSQAYYRLSVCAARRSFTCAAVGKGARLVLQSAGMGLGALLVIHDALSAGQMLASSLIMGRMFAALDAGLGQWSSLCAARESYRKLCAAPPPEALRS